MENRVPIASAELPKPARTAQWLTITSFFAANFFGAWWFGGYIGRVGGMNHVPEFLWLALGPMIALADVHGLAIFVVTTLIVLPLLVAAVSAVGVRRMLYLSGALIVWVTVGWWLHAG